MFAFNSPQVRAPARLALNSQERNYEGFFSNKRCAQDYFRSKEKVRVFELQKMKNILLQMRVSETDCALRHKI